jgi:3-oxoacyl-[acyl-carrier-protein] synthase II
MQVGRPVAVTAVGIVCGLGRSGDEVSAALIAHRSGAAPIRNYPVPGLASGTAVEVPGEVPALPGFADDRKVELLALAVEQALIDAPDVAPDRRGVFLGTGLSSVTPQELEEDFFPYVRNPDGFATRDLEKAARSFDFEAAVRDLAPGRVGPPRHRPERAAAFVAERFGATGPRGTTFSACAAGAEAIALGMRAIQRGEADVVLVGAHDAMVHPLGMMSFAVLGALTQTVGRPFDRRRDGFLLGEGAAILRLERLDRCRTRPLALLLGAGTSLDAHGITAPHPDGRGAEDSMRRALRDAGKQPSDVRWVNAHATATPVGDIAEAKAIARLLGPEVPTSSLKGAVGHVIAAAGAVEAAATVLAMDRGFTPGTVGCEEPDDLGITVQLGPTASAPGLTLSNSFGFGGQNCTLVIDRA